MKTRCILVLTLALLSCPSAVVAEEVTAASLQAAFLVNVLGYVTTPVKIPPADYRICIAATPETAAAVRQYIAVKGIAGKLAVAEVEPADAITGCSVLFVEDEAVRAAGHLFRHALQKSVLSIGNSGKSIEKGAMVRLYMKEKKLVFDINRKGAETAGVRFSSKLLSLAQKVH